MNAWYNEIEPYAAQWIENLAAGGHVAAGPVERRSVLELQAVDVPDGRQCHFFAGIGGWSRALRLAGWPDDVPVWTGSCPCQPFSGAGHKRGFADERHLWPIWFELIRQHRPAVIFGEQVASPDGLKWLDTVSADLEGSGYAVGTADLCAAGVGAPHIRQRLYFVAVADSERRHRINSLLWPGKGGRGASALLEATGGGEAGDLANTERGGSGTGRPSGEDWRPSLEPDRHGAIGELGNAGGAGSRRHAGADARAEAEGDRERRITGRVGDESELAGTTRGFWFPADWIECRDEKARPVEPGTFPLAHGISGRVGQLRGYGNAISPQVAEVFIRAAMSWIEERGLSASDSRTARLHEREDEFTSANDHEGAKLKALLLQLDGKVPNIALMRMSTHLKERGAEVEFRHVGNATALGLDLWDRFDSIYASLIFERTRPLAEYLLKNRPDAVVGGTGWDFTTTLEAHGVAAATRQDYSLYPSWKQSIGFTQRGCRLKCSFCVVPKKEGKVTEEQTIAELWRGEPHPRHLILLDNDFFGQPNWRDRISEIREGKFKVSFNQGINARFLDEETAAAIGSVDYRDDSMKDRRIYTAWDNKKDEARLFRGLELLVKHGVKPRHIMVYMLVGYWAGERHEDREIRRQKLRDFGALPYPMPYVRTPDLVAFQRWVIGGYDKGIPWDEWMAANGQPRNLTRRAVHLPMLPGLE